jgi:hypothetical protein
VRFRKGASDEEHACTQTQAKKHTSTKEKKKRRETPIINIVLVVLKNTITHRET